VQYALDDAGTRIEATKGTEAFCPCCQGLVLAKCGVIKVHHWAHKAGIDCDSWYEPETEWHRNWKLHFEPHQVEVPIGSHRADIRTDRNLVIELQNSPISPGQIQERERFYKNMVWIVNAQDFADRFFLMKRMGGDLISFKWKQMKPSWRFARRPVFLDFGKMTIRDLLGVKHVRARVAYDANLVSESFASLSVERYGPRNGAYLDPSLATLNQDILQSGMLRINTIYESGHGSAKAVNHSQLKKQFGIAEAT
jgi:hypothetical protein